MKKTKQISKRASAKRRRVLSVAALAVVLVLAAAVVAVAKYGSSGSKSTPAAAAKQANYVTVEVNGKKIQVNALALQQGPLTQEQSQQIADALQNNKSTDGLVQVQHADGTVEMDLQGRFQNVMLAKKNDDGSVSQACVDNPEAAKAFLHGADTTTTADTTNKTDGPRKAALQQ